MTTKSEPMRAIQPFGLRMQKPLRDAIEAAAEASGRSVNTEIVMRLTKSLAVGGPIEPPVHKGGKGAAEPGSSYGLSATERLLVEAFRDLDADVQLGLISFLRALAAKRGRGR